MTQFTVEATKGIQSLAPAASGRVPTISRITTISKEFHMEAEAAKYIGAGLACLGMAGTSLALGRIFGDFLSGALRNPSAADSQFGRLVFGFAVTEALGIFSLLVALLLLFAV
jgi:F-type H+-transporting ATPase subunit c